MFDIVDVVGNLIFYPENRFKPKKSSDKKKYLAGRMFYSSKFIFPLPTGTRVGRRNKTTYGFNLTLLKSAHTLKQRPNSRGEK